jgi:hypothetical protein
MFGSLPRFWIQMENDVKGAIKYIRQSGQAGRGKLELNRKDVIYRMHVKSIAREPVA